MKVAYDYKFLKKNTFEQLLPYIPDTSTSSCTDHKEIKRKLRMLDRKIEARKYPTPKALSQRAYYWDRDESLIPQIPRQQDPIDTVEPVMQYYLKQGDWKNEPDSLIKQTVDLSSSIEAPRKPFNVKIPKLKLTKKKKIEQVGEVLTDRTNKSSANSEITIGRYHRQMKADYFYHVINPLKQDIKPDRKEKQACFNKAFKILEDLIPESLVAKQQHQQQVDVVQQYSSSESEIKIEQKRQKVPLTKGQRVRQCIMAYIKRLKRCKLTHAQVIRDDVFSMHPYSKPCSLEFFDAIKDNNEIQAKQYITKYPYLVYDFDNAQMTGLHWAAKRGFVNLVKLLIQSNADIDAKDIVNRTPLYIATDYAHGKDSVKYIEIIQILLSNQAYPWSYDHIKYSQVIREDKKVKELFAVSRKIHLILLLTPPQLKDFIWNKEVPAMTAIKNVNINEEKQKLTQNEILKGNPHMDPRLKQFYLQKLTMQKRKMGNSAYQEIEKQIQSEQAIFEFVRRQPFQAN